MMNCISSSVSICCFDFIKDKNTQSVIKRGWMAQENNNLFPLFVAIWVWASPLRMSQQTNPISKSAAKKTLELLQLMIFGCLYD